MTQLVRQEILKEYESGNIIINPFNMKNLGENSYDCTLGEYYFRQNSSANLVVYNPFDESHVRKLWGIRQRAKSAIQTFKYLQNLIEPPERQLGQKSLEEIIGKGISLEDKIILVNPGEMILCHTREFIGGKENIIPKLASRSTSRRNGLSVCQCAGKGDVGYRTIWTLEITNDTKFRIPLVVGRRYAQMEFVKTSNLEGIDYSKRGKYDLLGDKITNEANYEELFKLWESEEDRMLPKMYKDWEINNDK